MFSEPGSSTTIIIRYHTHQLPMLCCLFIYSKQGLLSHVFSEPGVFYYSDQNFQEAAEYIGTVIVKPKPKEHRVMVTENGFDPGTGESRQIHRSVLDFVCFLFFLKESTITVTVMNH